MSSIIQVGFSRPKEWAPFAALIMWGYGIPYDHVYIKYHSDTYNRDIIYQASKLMVNFMSPVIFLQDNIIIKEFNISISDENRKKMLQFAIDNAGKAYGVKEAFGMALVRIAELLGKKIKNPFSDGDRTYVCSELAGYILSEYAGNIIPKDLDDVTPLDVYNYLTLIGNNSNG